jgi:tetratricopeptide (TPR) repeat protein
MALRLEDPETMMRYYFVEGQASPDLATAAKVWEEFFAIGSRVETISKGEMALEVMFAGAHFLYGDWLRDAGHNEEAAAHYRQSLERFRHTGDVDLIAYPIGNLGRLALQAGRVGEAYNSFMESVAISRAVGNRVGIADWLQQLGNAALAMGDLSQAESCYEEALALYQEMGNLRACPDTLADLGYAALINGDENQSRRYLRESLSAYRKFGEMMARLGIGWSVMLPPEFRLCLQTIALLDVGEGKFERALTLLSAAAAHHSRFGYGADLGMGARVEAALSTIQTQLSKETFSQAWENGRSMSVETILAYDLD